MDAAAAPTPESARLDPADASAVHEAVRGRYAHAAQTSLLAPTERASCCGPTSCCGSEPRGLGPEDPISRDLYAVDETPSAGALAASLGCGNPTALAQMSPGEVVLDLGSGGGLDVLLSARRVAPGGTAYGLDMTPEMLALARRHQAEAGIDNAEFLLGTIEAVPLPEESVDVVISNCVINLTPDKDRVFAEAFRVLRAGGRLAISDIVLLRPLPAQMAGLVALWTGCVAGALLDSDYVARLRAAGFEDAAVEVTRTYSTVDLAELAASLAPSELPDGVDVDSAVALLDGAFASAFVRAVKPA